MDVQVLYATQVRTIVGFDCESVSLSSGTTVRQLIDVLCDRHGGRLLQLAANGGPHLMVCVNDCQVIDFAAHVLADGDEVLMMSPVSGG